MFWNASRLLRSMYGCAANRGLPVPPAPAAVGALGVAEVGNRLAVGDAKGDAATVVDVAGGDANGLAADAANGDAAVLNGVDAGAAGVWNGLVAALGVAKGLAGAAAGAAAKGFTGAAAGAAANGLAAAPNMVAAGGGGLALTHTHARTSPFVTAACHPQSHRREAHGEAREYRHSGGVRSTGTATRRGGVFAAAATCSGA